MPQIALSRIARPGCSTRFAWICASRSGDAFTSAHSVSDPDETTIDDWVRGTARNVPSRTPAQFAQLQFHWGKPPPAAEPRTRIFMGWKDAGPPFPEGPCHGPDGAGPQPSSAIRHVHRDFHAEAQIDGRRSFPFHVQVLVSDPRPILRRHP